MAVAKPSSQSWRSRKVLAAGEELARRQRAQQAADGAREQERAGAGTLALAGDVDHRHLEPVVDPGGDDEVAGEGGAAGGAQLGGDVPLGREGGDPSLAQDAVAEVDEHRLALQAGHAEPRAAERRQQDHEAEAEDDDHGDDDPGVDGRLPGHHNGEHEEHEDDEPRQLARPEHEAGQHERHQQADQRDVVGEEPDRSAGRRRHHDQQHEDPRPARHHPVDHAPGPLPEVGSGEVLARRSHGRAPRDVAVSLTANCTARERKVG